ncbi:MAG TPA: hypothetical protein VJK54_06930 [Chthoniobacterales bacterium]|nr:hypothetical protein [Chthoniobacterales bacterium]
MLSYLAELYKEAWEMTGKFLQAKAAEAAEVEQNGIVNLKKQASKNQF